MANTMTSAIGIGWKAKFVETDQDALHQLILDHPLSTLISHLPDATPNLQATHIPSIFDPPSAPEADKDPSILGTLRGHIALKNPHAIALAQACDPSTQTLDQEVMVLFNSPTESYVTPSFYTSTKLASGQVVPTWFFSAVQVYGTLTLHSSASFLEAQVTDLTRHGEKYLMGFPAEQAWKISDAPEGFRKHLTKVIVGVEIKITRMEGKKKSGQEIAASDQMGCIRGFTAMGTENGKLMARQIEASMKKDERRAGVFEKEKGLVQGKKVKGRFGWYFPAAEAGGKTKLLWWIAGVMAIASILLGLVTRILY